MPKKSVSIRVKFVLAVSLAILAAQAVVAGVFVWRDAGLYARTKQETLTATAQSIAASVASAARRGDPDAAYRALRAIGSIPGASYVRLEDKSGATLAETGRVEQLVGDAIQTEPGREIDRLELLGSRTLEISAPVVDSGETVGRIVLVGDITDLPKRLTDALTLMGWGALGALLLAVLIAGRMLGRMTSPLVDLAGAMTRVGASHDYNVTMSSSRGDEIGVLVRGFDKMLGEIRQRNAELAAHRDRLEIEVADRTADYRRAMELAEDANRSKSDFLATMSHEIRTPMNGVLVMAEMLAASELPPRARKNADVIVRSGQTLLAIINDILDFSKIEAGKLDVETLAVDPVEAAEDVLRLFGDRAQSKGLDLADIVRLPRGVTVDADPVRLAQVLSNLVNNALKFTEAGGVTLEIGPDPADAQRVRFAVVDTGIGIPEDKLDGIFGAFTQADQSTTRKFGGTGLGLAIAKKLVAAMGGDLSVTSAAGQGATFFFSLPMSAACAFESAPRLAAPELAIVCVSGEGSRAHLVAALSFAGFSVEICADDLGERARGARLVVADVDRLAPGARLEIAGNGAIVAVAGLGEAPDRLLSEGRVDRIVQRPLASSETRSIVDAVVEGRSIAVVQQAAVRSDLPRFPNARVLVVDDAAVNREVASEALKRLGIAADLANDGVEAVAAVKARTYDLVLMDGSMPEMDGYEATRVIRAHEADTGAAHLPIVALTAHVVGAAANAWREAGMDGVLHKPFTLAALAQCLAEHLAPETRLAAEEVVEPAQDAADETPDVNPKIIAGLREMSGGDNAAVKRIVALYCAHAPQSLAAISRAFEARDLDALGSAAHALKSMSANIGAVAVYTAAQSIERACRLDRRMPDDPLIARLPEMVDFASAEVSRLANEGAAPERRSA